MQGDRALSVNTMNSLVTTTIYKVKLSTVVDA